VQTDSDKKTKPNYNSVDLSEVELEDVSPSSVRLRDCRRLLFDLSTCKT